MEKRKNVRSIIVGFLDFIAFIRFKYESIFSALNQEDMISISKMFVQIACKWT